MKTLLAFFLPLVFLLPAHAQEAGNPLRYGKKSGRIVSGTGYAVTKGHVKKHMAEGRWKTVSAANGNVLQVHRYSKGYYDGEQDYYNEDLVAGKSLLVTKSFYRMGRKDSAWISYNSKGAVIWISHYHLDTLMSDSSWSADGKLLMAKSYRADGFVTTQCFWPNGRVRSASTLNGTKHEGWVIDNPDSGWKDSLPQFYSHYSGGKKDGGERARLSGGYSMTCNWKSGLYDGEFRLFYPGGKIEFSGQFRDGIKTGAWKYYSPSGVLLQTTWFHNGCFLPAGNSTREYDTLPQPPPDSVYTFDGNGRLSCISRSALRPEEFTGYLSETFLARTHEQFFDTTGYIKEEGDLSGTRKDGTWKTFYPGGKLRSSLDYVSGTANGTYTVFYPGGKKMITAEVNDFLAVKAVFYGKDGKPLALSSPKVDEMSGQWFYPRTDVLWNNPVPHVVDEDGPEEVFAYVQEMPGFPGGPYALQKFLAKNIRYPEMEKENGVQGTVFVSFTVMKDGTVGDVKVVKGVPGGPGLGKEAVRVISQMPAWAPGKQNGRAVNVRMMQPVKFVLQ